MNCTDTAEVTKNLYVKCVLKLTNCMGKTMVIMNFPFWFPNSCIHFTIIQEPIDHGCSSGLQYQMLWMTQPPLLCSPLSVLVIGDVSGQAAGRQKIVIKEGLSDRNDDSIAITTDL